MVVGTIGVVLVLLVSLFSFSGEKTSSNSDSIIDNLSLFDEYMEKGEKAFVEKNYKAARKYLQLALEQQKSEKAIALIEAINLAEKKSIKALELFIDSPVEEVKTNQNIWIVRGRVIGESPRVFCCEVEAVIKEDQFELHLPLDGEGKKKYDIIATDIDGKRQKATLQFFLDKTPPELSIDAPEFTIEKKVNIGVHVQENNPWTVKINDKTLFKVNKESFSFEQVLTPGRNIIDIIVEDSTGNATHEKVSINYSSKCPAPKIITPKKNEFVTLRKRMHIACVADSLYKRVYINKKVALLSGGRFVLYRIPYFGYTL